MRNYSQATNNQHFDLTVTRKVIFTGRENFEKALFGTPSTSTDMTSEVTILVMLVLSSLQDMCKSMTEEVISQAKLQ